MRIIVYYYINGKVRCRMYTDVVKVVLKKSCIYDCYIFNIIMKDKELKHIYYIGEETKNVNGCSYNATIARI
jgi:hypothetical protein